MNNAARAVPSWRETDRLAALEGYRILDTPVEQDFEDIVQLAAEVFEAPIAVVNLIATGRQWFKAEVGIGVRELPLDVSICAHAILQEQTMVVRDTTRDSRFACNPLVTADGGLRFYAGALLKTPEGLPIGTICVLDRAARPDGITPFQQRTLEILARQVMTQLELRRALSRQREEDQRHRLILDSAIDYAIITTDLAGLVTSWSEGARRTMGWDETEMCGRLCDEFFTPEDREAGIPAREMGLALTKGRGIDERWHVRKDGSRFWASGELMPLTGDDGDPVGFLKILRDRTVQHEAQIALESSEARTRLALEAGGVGVWESTPALRELNWDARTRELLGHTPDEPLDYEHSFLARVHPDDRDEVLSTIAEALAPGGSGVIDLQYRTISKVDGRERWIHSRGALPGKADGVQKFVGTVRDITSEKDAENHRRLLTAELQHRIKNTLAVVQSIVSQSLRTAVTPAEARDAIGERLATLGHAHDLLTQTSWTGASMRAIVDGATRLHGARPDGILINGPDILLSARAALAFSMSLHELATNAAKYGALSNAVGHVELTWSTERNANASFLNLKWQEYGGPPVNLPERAGFGTRLMAGLARDLGGAGALEYAPDGVQWRLRSNLDQITEQL